MHRSRSRSWSATRKPFHDGCRILYRDIGDYLRREEKLAVLREAGSIAGIEDWRTITPDRHHDWIGQRSEEFQKLYPVGSKAAKAGRTDEAIFKLYSRGLATSRDAYIYNFSSSMPAQRTPARWWAIISELCGSWTNSRMDHPRTRSFTRSQAVIPRMFDGIENSRTTCGGGKKFPIQQTESGRPSIGPSSNSTAMSNTRS